MNVHRALRLQILLALGCAGDKHRSTACLVWEPGDPPCPDADEVRPADLFPLECNQNVIAVLDGPFPGDCSYDSGGGEIVPDDCFYDVRVVDSGDCAYGRPWGALADPVAREDWAARLSPRLEGVDRAAQAGAWTNIGQQEHASVASFAAFILDLLANGAPPELVAEAQRALGDEIRHARLAFGLASSFAGAPVGPGPLPSSSRASADLRALAITAAQDGCLAETRAAASLAERAEVEPDPVVAGVLRGLAQDEARHAVLAWRVLKWAVQAGGVEVRAAAAEVLAGAPRDRLWAEVVRPVMSELGLAA